MSLKSVDADTITTGAEGVSSTTRPPLDERRRGGAAAFMNQSERWLEEGETVAVDPPAVDDWLVSGWRPDD